MPRTARAAIIFGFDQLVSELGGNPAAVQKTAGVDLTQLTDPDTLISAQLVANVLNLSARETACDHFGLELARRRNLDNYLGILGKILRTAPTLREALRDVFAVFSIHSEASLWQLQTSGDVSYIRFSPLEEPGSGDSSGYNSGYNSGYKQVQQLVIALLWRFISVLSGNRWHPTTVCFSHSRPTDDLPYRRIFDTYLEFDADFCGVVFHAADLKIELTESEVDLHEKLRREAKTIREARTKGFEEDVRILIRKNLELRQVGEESITRFYPFERRTLQRKLRGFGTSYRELLKEVRFAMAMQLLADSEASITRVADRLCYKDLPNFTKAFKLQTGQSPREWRKRNAPGAEE